jgi:hypothetical protein
MGILIEALLWTRHLNHSKHVKRSGSRLLFRYTAMQTNPLSDLKTNAHRRIECRHRVLRNERHLIATHVKHLLLAQPSQIATEEVN